MENKDLVKESWTSLNKGFLKETESVENGDVPGLSHLVEFFKAQMDNLESDLVSKLDQKIGIVDCLKVRLLSVLFGKGYDVAKWVADDLEILKILSPDRSGQIQSALDDLENIKQMASALSLQSLKVLLRPLLDETFQGFLDSVVLKVRNLK